MRITNETTVTINYKVSEQNGSVLEQTEAGEPVIYLQGLEMMLPAVEDAMEGKIPGDKVKLELSAADAFGEKHKDLITKIPVADFEDAEGLAPGQDIIVGNGEEEVIMTIVGIDNNEVTLDGNHPFAGKDIVFEIEVIEVHKTTDEDLEQFNHVHDENCNHDH